MIETLILCTFVLGGEAAPPSADAGAPLPVVKEEAASTWQGSPLAADIPAASTPARPLGGVVIGLYRLWKPFSPLGRAYREGEFPYRSRYKHPYLRYRGSYFQGHYDYHRLADYPWHAPVSPPAAWATLKQSPESGMLPQGAMPAASGARLLSVPQQHAATPDHPDSWVPQ